MERKITRVPYEPGKLVITQGAANNIDPDAVFVCLMRHFRCDWGDLCAEDWALNDAAVQNGDRLLSAYTIDEQKLWIITEADRSCTTLLLPEEY